MTHGVVCVPPAIETKLPNGALGQGHLGRLDLPNEKRNPWPRSTDANTTDTPGISARIAAIGPSQTTNPANRNRKQVRFAISASPNGPTKSANRILKISVAIRADLSSCSKIIPCRQRMAIEFRGTSTRISEISEEIVNVLERIFEIRPAGP